MSLRSFRSSSFPGGIGRGRVAYGGWRTASPNGPRPERTSTLPTSTFPVSALLHTPRISSTWNSQCLSFLSAVMALVTYILLAALHSGLNSRFHPEILGITASKALAIILLDFCFVKSGCYVLNIPASSLLYLLCSTCILTQLSRAACQVKYLTSSRTAGTSSSGKYVHTTSPCPAIH